MRLSASTSTEWLIPVVALKPTVHMRKGMATHSM
jgi:hypothetical protein